MSHYVVPTSLPHYWNRIYCNCVCHLEAVDEMRGLMCSGCQFHRCIEVEKIYTLRQSIELCNNHSTIRLF